MWDAVLIARVLLTISILFPLSSFSEDFGTTLKFKNPTDSVTFFLKSNQNELALEAGLKSIDLLDDPCLFEDIFLWTSNAAINLKELSLAVKLLRDGIACNSSRLIFWQEMYYLIKDSADFNETFFLLFSKKSLSSEDYKNLWLKVKSKKQDKKIFSDFFFDFKPIYSSNFNNGLIVDSVEIFNLPFKTSDESKNLNGLGLEFYALNRSRVIDQPFHSLEFNIGFSATDFPSNKGDSYEIFNEVKYVNLSNYYPFELTHAFKKRYFSKEPQFLSNYLILDLKRVSKSKINAIRLSLKKNQYYKSKFQNGEGLGLIFKFNTKKFIYFPRVDYYKAYQDTYSYRGKGISVESKTKQKIAINLIQNSYKEKSLAFGKTRKDKVYGFSLDLRSSNLAKKGIFPKVSYLKVDSNIGIYEAKRLEFTLNF